MFDPPHPGNLVRSCIEESNWTVAAAAERLRVGRTSLSRLLNGKHGISPAVALALEDVGWSTAEHLASRTGHLRFGAGPGGARRRLSEPGQPVHQAAGRQLWFGRNGLRVVTSAAPAWAS